MNKVDLNKLAEDLPTMETKLVFVYYRYFYENWKDETPSINGNIQPESAKAAYEMCSEELVKDHRGVDLLEFLHLLIEE